MFYGKKIYAVKVGRTNGIFETWDECKASVNGYPGALYKSFTNMADAYAYLNLESKQMSLFDMPSDDSVDDSDFPVIKESVEDDDKPFSNSVKAVAYVDGSYNIATKHFHMVVLFSIMERNFIFLKILMTLNSLLCEMSQVKYLVQWQQWILL